jgi:hypothetical protein
MITVDSGCWDVVFQVRNARPGEACSRPADHRVGGPAVSQRRAVHDHGGFCTAGGLHPKSEMPDQAAQPPRRLTIEWTTDL